MSANRISILLSILKGFIAAVICSLIGMLLIAVICVSVRISDNVLYALNQVLKTLSILFGTWICVGRGGRNGLITGAVLAMLYIIAGYACYAIFGGECEIVSMLGEILLGSTVGGLTGSVLANLPPKGRKKRTR